MTENVIEYVPLGVYILTDLRDTHNLSDGKKCFITGMDKAYLMNDKYGKLKNPNEIIKIAGKGDFDPSYYINYLKNKFQ